MKHNSISYLKMIFHNKIKIIEHIFINTLLKKKGYLNYL